MRGEPTSGCEGLALIIGPHPEHLKRNIPRAWPLVSTRLAVSVDAKAAVQLHEVSCGATRRHREKILLFRISQLKNTRHAFRDAKNRSPFNGLRTYIALHTRMSRMEISYCIHQLERAAVHQHQRCIQLKSIHSQHFQRRWESGRGKRVDRVATQNPVRRPIGVDSEKDGGGKTFP